jgi:transitional endoplasmic reticulum ATPase
MKQYSKKEGVKKLVTNDSSSNPIDFVSLKVTETNPKFVGKGMALIDPKVVEEMQLTTGDVIEITTSSGRRRGIKNN